MQMPEVVMPQPWPEAGDVAIAPDPVVTGQKPAKEFAGHVERSRHAIGKHFTEVHPEPV